MDYGFEHVGITVRNLEGSMKWYETNFGMRGGEIKDKPNLRLRLVSMKLGDSAVELLSPYSLTHDSEIDVKEDLPGLLGKIGTNHIALSVDDLYMSYGNLVLNGTEMVTPIMDSRVFFCKDLDGVLIEVRKK